MLSQPYFSDAPLAKVIPSGLVELRFYRALRQSREVSMALPSDLYAPLDREDLGGFPRRKF